MMLKTSLALLAIVTCGPCFAVTQCGPFTLSPGPGDGWFRINKIKPDTQKVTFFNQKEDYDNIQVQWMVQRDDAQGWLGIDYIKRDGKAILNVEAIRSNLDQPRIFGSFDCVKVK